MKEKNEAAGARGPLTGLLTILAASGGFIAVLALITAVIHFVMM